MESQIRGPALASLGVARQPLMANPLQMLNKFIAHCENMDAKVQLFSHQPFTDSIIVIGPEGDFSTDEISAALQNSFLPVALGNTRLRTETAGLVAATLLAMAE